MVIDVHHHLPFDWEPYVEKLRKECERLGIDKIAVIAPVESNDLLVEALHQHGDFLIGMGFVRLGEDSPRTVDHLKGAGCSGIKFIWPLKNYDDDDFMPIYARCEVHQMPSLFHLGIVARQSTDRLMDVSMARMQAIQLDRIARRFPDLPIIGAHLGNPDYHIASELARMHPNVYFDLTGSTLKKKSPEFIGEVFWWARNEQYGKMGHGVPPYQKILFGTDVEVELMADVLGDYQRVMDALDMSEEDRSAIMGGTAAGLFGLSDV